MSVDIRRSIIVASLAGVTILLVALFVRQAMHYATFTAALARAPGMQDLTAAGAPNAHIHLGDVPSCDATDATCWLAPEFDATSWHAVTLPRFDLREHPAHATTVGRGFVHYLIPLEISAASRQEAMAFSPRYIGHGDVTVWVNGVLTARYQGLPQNASIAIDLPPTAVASGRAIVAIKGKLDVAHEGIFHRSALYVGPKAVVDQLALGKTYGMENYYLLFLVGKGAIFLVFAMLFLAGDNDFGLGRFLVYALAATTENLLIGDFLPPAFDLHLRVVLCFALKMIGITALAAFFTDRAALVRRIWRVGLVATMIVILAAADYGYGSHTMTIQMLFAMANAAMLMASLWTLYQAVRTRQLLSATVLGTYVALIAYEYLGRRFDGFDYRAVYDLLLFVFAAYLCARALRHKNVVIAAQNAEIAKHRIHATIAQTTQMLAHDVRKPLNLLEMTAQAVARESDPERAAKLLSVALPSIRRAKAAADAMIADVMAIGSAFRLATEPVRLASAMDAATRDLTLPAGVRVECDCPETLTVDADPHKLLRVLANLIDNAVAATGKSGVVRLQAKPTVKDDGAAAVHLSVHNAGAFIPSDRLAEIFEPFKTFGKGQGTGLGLTIVRRFVEAHGGSVVCHSDGVQGTTFEVVWPAAVRAASAGLNVNLDVFVRLLGVAERASFAK